jgi:hypothetical protein
MKIKEYANHNMNKNMNEGLKKENELLSMVKMP